MCWGWELAARNKRLVLFVLLTSLETGTLLLWNWSWKSLGAWYCKRSLQGLPLCWHSDQWHQWRSHAWSGINTLCTWYSTLFGALLQSCGTNAMSQKTTLVLYSYVWWPLGIKEGFEANICEYFSSEHLAAQNAKVVCLLYSGSSKLDLLLVFQQLTSYGQLGTS